jgi:DNA-directed RNA polymerase specialized sigma24 family protein
VAACLRDHRDPVLHKDLGGDPLRDVVLAEAIVRQNPKALALLDQEYRNLALGLAASLGQAQEGEDRWHDCLLLLMGDKEHPGKLASFRGHCGLKFWLGTVLKREFFHTKAGPQGSSEPGTEEESFESFEESLISQDCLILFQTLIRQGMARLSPREQYILKLMFAEGLTGRRTGATVGIHPGNVARIKDKALEALRRILDGEDAPEERQRQEQQECLRQLLAGEDRLTFGHALMEALRSIAEEGQ